MLKIRCRMCGNEVHGSGTCGCPNMASIRNDKITALDLSQVIMLETYEKSTNKHLTNMDLMWQEERRKRGFKKLDFEVR